MAETHSPQHALVFPFVGALLQRTLDCPTVEAHQQALQGFLDDLTPWLSPADLPTLLGQPFTLFDHLAFTPNGTDGDEDVWVPSPWRGRCSSAPGSASGGWIPWCAAPKAAARCLQLPCPASRLCSASQTAGGRPGVQVVPGKTPA